MAVEPLRRRLYEMAAKRARAMILGGEVSPSSKVTPTLLKSGDYVRAIGVYGKGKAMRVGLPDGTHSSGLPYEMIWRIHEFGNRRQPARPHLIPAVQEVTRRIPQVLKDFGFAVTVKGGG